jgi:hypothetical protein
MIDSIIEISAKKCFPDSNHDSQRMIRDFQLLKQSFKLVFPIITVFILGFSLSLVSVIMQICLVWYLYCQTLTCYTMIRTHNVDHMTSDPETELWTILMTTKSTVMSHIF